MAFQPNAFQPTAFQTIPGPITGTITATLAPALVAAFVGAVLVTGSFAATVQPDLQTTFMGQVHVSGTLHATVPSTLEASFTGTSDGTIIVIPRDISGGIAYLVEVEAFDTTANEVVVLRYSSVDFNSLPSDAAPNAHYDNRLDSPGNYDRHLFSQGTTSGSLSVGAGVIEIKNIDGALDRLKAFAFDGYTVRVLTLPRLLPSYADTVVVFEGTMENAELTWKRFTLTIRDRLAELDRPIQTALYAGTTISGGLNEAEGLPTDLKGKPKPLTFGRPLCVPAVASNSYDRIYDLGENGLSSVAELRDKGVSLLASVGDYATIAALRTASMPGGRFGTQLIGGRFRPQSAPSGQLTAAPVEGATAASRTAAQIARRMLLRMGLVEGEDFLASDIDALDALNSAEIGYWIGADETSALQAIGDVLGSIGASIVPDRLGVMRMRRFGAPATPPVATFTLAEILEPSGQGIERLATGDSGKGVPAWKVSVQYARNWAVTDANGLAGSVQVSEPTYAAFAAEEWRTAVAQNPAIKSRHRLAPELTFQSYFVNQADAQAEAARQLALHSVPRDRFKVPFKSFLTEGLDLGSIVRLQLPRFELDTGKDFVVIGMAENYGRSVTTLDLWG